MTEMKIELVNPTFLCTRNVMKEQHGVDVMVPVVRLPAVDQVIAEAVKFAEAIVEQYEKNPSRLYHIPLDSQYQDAQAFLASDTVAQWRERQKEGKKS